MSNPAVLSAVSPAVPSGQKRLNDLFVADKEVQHQRAAGDGVDDTPAPRRSVILQVLATDTSNGDTERAGEMTMSSDIGCSSSGTKEGTGSFLSSSVPPPPPRSSTSSTVSTTKLFKGKARYEGSVTLDEELPKDMVAVC